MKAIHRGSQELLLTLYGGCSHGCWYCWNRCSLKDKHDKLYDEIKNEATIENIEHDLIFLKKTQKKMPVVISNKGDPYDLGRKPKGLSQYIDEDSYVRKVLKIFRKYDHPFMILTKGGTKAVEDFDLYGPNDWFGVTLTCDNDADSLKNEPRAALWADRIAALKEAHNRGIHTWVSCEPVLDRDQTLHLIELTHEFVDYFRVGKLNHYEAKIDWPKFRDDAEALLGKCGKQRAKEACEKGYLLNSQLINAKGGKLLCKLALKDKK